MFEVSLGRIQEIARNEVVIALTIGDLSNRIAIKAEDDGTRVAQDDGRVGRDQELGVTRRIGMVNSPWDCAWSDLPP